MLSDLQLDYMVPRNSTQLLNINTAKFQVEHEPVYKEIETFFKNKLNWIQEICFKYWFCNQQDSFTNMIADNY